MKIPTRTWIHGCGQHEASWESQGHSRAGNCDRAIFQRPAQNFKDIAGKLGQFIEKQQTIAGQRNFAGTRDYFSANKSGIGDSVVR
jgi:hypothetical protein